MNDMSNMIEMLCALGLGIGTYFAYIAASTKVTVARRRRTGRGAE